LFELGINQINCGEGADIETSQYSR